MGKGDQIWTNLIGFGQIQNLASPKYSISMSCYEFDIVFSYRFFCWLMLFESFSGRIAELIEPRGPQRGREGYSAV